MTLVPVSRFVDPQFAQKSDASASGLSQPDAQAKPEPIPAFVGSLNKAQKLALSEITLNGPRTDAELRSTLKLDGNKALAGILAGITKGAKRKGVKQEVVSKEMTRIGNGLRGYKYSLNPEVAIEIVKALEELAKN